MTPRDPAAVLAAALPVLEAVESLIESIERPGQVMDWDDYFALRRNFYAFRAAIEAGAPLAWAVAEEEETR